MVQEMNEKILEGIDHINICKYHCDYVLEKYSENDSKIDHCNIAETENKNGKINPIGICGNPCEFNCPKFGKECECCRSNNISCSFAASFVDKICPNVKCSKENNIDGCYQCKKLEDCKIGFFGIDVYFGKASALFIKKYSEKCYLETLKKAISTGEIFIKKYFENGTDGVNETLNLLEKYLD